MKYTDCYNLVDIVEQPSYRRSQRKHQDVHIICILFASRQSVSVIFVVFYNVIMLLVSR